MRTFEPLKKLSPAQKPVNPFSRFSALQPFFIEFAPYTLTLGNLRVQPWETFGQAPPRYGKARLVVFALVSWSLPACHMFSLSPQREFREQLRSYVEFLRDSILRQISGSTMNSIDLVASPPIQICICTANPNLTFFFFLIFSTCADLRRKQALQPSFSCMEPVRSWPSPP